jgi:hypothetical protein
MMGGRGGILTRRSLVVFVAALLLGALSASLAYDPLPARLAWTVTWVAGGIVGALLVAIVLARRFFKD